MKTEGELHERSRALVPRLMVAFVVLITLVVVALFVDDRQIIQSATRTTSGRSSSRRRRWSPSVVAWRMRPARARLRGLRRLVGDDRAAAHLGRHRALPEPAHLDHDPAYNLTTTNAAAADNTLQVCLIVALIGMPFVLLYTAGVVLHLPGQGRRRARGLLNRSGVTMR